MGDYWPAAIAPHLQPLQPKDRALARFFFALVAPGSTGKHRAQDLRHLRQAESIVMVQPHGATITRQVLRAPVLHNSLVRPRDRKPFGP
ncbi:hypothetical protein DBR12_12995 [Acidovorax sp. HMWF029]|nr:hypothetical protein DBR12_12995 [Acidovorax sp. HMWF029]